MSKRLYARDTLLGTLTVEDVDHPRVYYRLDPTAEYEAFRPILDSRLNQDSFEERYTAVEALDLRVLSEDGTCRRLSFIFIEGSQAVIRGGFYIETTDDRLGRQFTFWRVLEDEIGPEPCREPGCTRLRMRLSVLCKRHHFRMITGEDFMGEG